jgi:hypothetical protein
MLNRDHSSRGKTSSIAGAIYLIENWYLRIAWTQKISVQRVADAVVNSPCSRHQCLADNLAAKHTLPAVDRAVAAKQINLYRFEV